MICLWVWIQIKARSGRGLYIRSQAHSFFSLIFIGNIIGELSKIHCVCVCVSVRVCVCVCVCYADWVAVCMCVCCAGRDIGCGRCACLRAVCVCCVGQCTVCVRCAGLGVFGVCFGVHVVCAGVCAERRGD